MATVLSVLQYRSKNYSPPAGGRPQMQPNYWGSVLFMHTAFNAELPKFDVVTHMGRRFVFKWSATPVPKGSRSQRSPILGLPFYFCFRWSATPPPQRGGVPSLPNFGVPFYLCVHP